MSVSSGTLAITLISLNSSFSNIKAKLKSFDSSQSMLPHVLFNARGVTAWQNGDKFARRLKWSCVGELKERPREGRESLAKWEDFISCVLFLKLILGNCLAACTNTYIHNTWKTTNLPMPPPSLSCTLCALRHCAECWWAFALRGGGLKVARWEEAGGLTLRSQLLAVAKCLYPL